MSTATQETIKRLKAAVSGLVEACDDLDASHDLECTCAQPQDNDCSVCEWHKAREVGEVARRQEFPQ